MMAHQCRDQRLDLLQQGEFRGAERPRRLAPHQRQHDGDLLVDRHEEADFLRKPGLHIVGAVVFRGEEPIGRKLPHPPDARLAL
ncbi:hypothetical protein D9M72_489270 [compost metagenome]